MRYNDYFNKIIAFVSFVDVDEFLQEFISVLRVFQEGDDCKFGSVVFKSLC